jgi:hypothetical protein
MAAEILFNKKIGQAPVVSEPTIQQDIIEEPVQGAPKVHTIIQSANPTISIPQVIGEVMSGLPKELNQPLFINVNVHSQQTAVNAQADATQPSHKSFPHSPLYINPLYTLGKKLLNVGTWVRTHKYKSSFFCCLFGYGAVHYYLLRASFTLAQKSNWSFWRSLCSFEDLCQTNQIELTKNLLSSFEDIFKDTNHVANAHRFIKEANDELTLLKRFQWIMNIIDRCFLGRFFFVQRALLATIPDRLQRLEYLKNTIIGWLKEHQKTYSYSALFQNKHSTTLTEKVYE